MKNKRIIVYVALVFVIFVLVAIFPAILKGVYKVTDTIEEKKDIRENFSQSSTYMIGFEYSYYDLYQMAPVIVGKVRYDKKIEVEYKHTDEDGKVSYEVKMYDLSDQQYDNISSKINVREVFYLDPEESDPEDLCDGGFVYVFVYGADDEVIKAVGGLSPTGEKFREIRRVIFDNLPQDFKDGYAEYAIEVGYEDY